ncbi:hypothetical protein D7X74_07575 [Corallococcus sp. CA047B]|uniref:hypothetical protein n=1 Tax=Corallococcus sp. CA047B TaxID=2316729 RepID=UPI000EA34557|nr:hypothetical protein [Corallococcus sp. CA047B]RKH19141.1 hypothetical protein D7X74_07575 [Corallococcus sp. CA047B]
MTSTLKTTIDDHRKRAGRDYHQVPEGKLPPRLYPRTAEAIAKAKVGQRYWEFWQASPTDHGATVETVLVEENGRLRAYQWLGRNDFRTGTYVREHGGVIVLDPQYASQHPEAERGAKPYVDLIGVPVTTEELKKDDEE